MEIITKVFELIERLDNHREAYLESKIRARDEYIEKHGHPPYFDNWCKTIEMEERRELEFRRRMKAAMAEAKQRGSHEN